MAQKLVSLAITSAVAVARGNNDGSNRDNAISTTLIDEDAVKLILHSYNADNAGTQEIHGDLVVSGGWWYDKITFGYCM